MTLPKIDLDMPVPGEKARMLHEGLASAGQSLHADE